MGNKTGKKAKKERKKRIDAERRARIAAELRVDPGEAAGIADRPTRWSGDEELDHLDADELDDVAKAVLRRGVDELADVQELLWASGERSVLVVLQAMDAAGKDSTIEHVMSGVNPQGVDVHSFKTPSSKELAHSYLWRHWMTAPAKGRIAIFNRSHYEEVVTLRVHPEWLGAQRLPPTPTGEALWEARYAEINAFEQHLAHTGTAIIKFFLHVSKDEQKNRFLARLDEPEKEWKFSANDVAERRLWDSYMDAFERAITATSTPWAPWYVIPADSKPVMRAMVARLLVDLIDSLELEWPVVSDDERAINEQARAELLAEDD